MAFLDFMKNRPQLQPIAKPASPAPRQQAPPKDVTKVLSAEQLAHFREVGQRMRQATSHLRSNWPQPAGSDSGNAALLQKQNNQGKTQSPMSPTDQFKGQPSVQRPRSRGWER